jgi:hypothetical protein
MYRIRNILHFVPVVHIVLPLLIAVAASCWLLPSLGNGMLWQDEAQTALLARTTLRYGVPIAFDGGNSLSQESGDDYGPHGLWKWHMWLPFYVLAGFFKLFGESTAVARLPFALFGVATVVLTYFTALQLWRDTKTAVLACVLELACIPFELLVRQCRYYSPSMFFALLTFYAYLRIINGWRRGWILLGIAGVLLMNSHFIYLATAFGAIYLHAALWHRDRWRPLLKASILAGILCLPPVLWLATLSYKNYSHSVVTLQSLRFQTRTYCKLFLKQIVPYPLLLIPMAAGVRILLDRRFAERVFRRRLRLGETSDLIREAASSGNVEQSSSDSVQTAKGPVDPRFQFHPWLALLEPWALPILFAVLTLATIAPFTPYPFFRYLGPLIAPLLILVARSVIVAFRTQVVLGILATVCLAVWWPISSYVYELQHPFIGPIEGIVQLLNAQGKPGDVVVASYGDLPLKFYTRDRVYGGMAGDDLSKAVGARWLILRIHRVSDRIQPVRDFIRQQIATNPHYHKITLDVPDTEFENREEPKEHSFATVKNMPRVEVFELEP